MSMKQSTTKSAAATTTHLPPDFMEKRQEFLETKERRLQEEIAAEHAVLLRRHDAIVTGFREQCVRMRQWELESQRRHKEDRELYASRRAHEVELESIHQARLASLRAKHHDAGVAATEQNIVELEANIRRLGLDEERPPNAIAAAAASIVVEDPETSNGSRIMEIRRRKEVDIAARRDKLQRQYVAQQQQMLASKDVVRQQTIQNVVSRASQLLVADRDASLEARRKAIEGEIKQQMSHVFLEGECTRRLAAFRETDKAFSIAAETQRAVDNLAFESVRAEERKLELAAKATKISGLEEFFASFVESLVDVSIGVAVRNCVQLSDGTVLRRLNPPTAADWRATKERLLSTTAVQDRIDQRKIAVARARTLSNASPRVKRNSSVNLGSFSTSLVAKPASPGGGGIPGLMDTDGTPMGCSANASPMSVPVLDDVWDTEEADNLLEVVSLMDRNRFSTIVASAVASIHKNAVSDFEAMARTRLEAIETAGLAKAANAASWWCNVLGELPPAAVFVFGNVLSGVKLVSDGRYVGEVDEQYLLTPEKVSALLAALAPTGPAQPPQPADATATATAVSPAKPAKGKSAPTPGGGPRPTSASLRNASGGVPSSPVSPVAPQALQGEVVAFVAKRIVKHHHNQLDALVRKDNANGYPPSLLLAGFPLENSRFVEELNSALEKELEDEEKLWAPHKVLMSLEHNTPRGGGGGGIGTHRSSIGGGGGHTNPNTPHGSLFNGGAGPGVGGGGGAPSLHSGGGSNHENESLAASGPRHRPLPAAFSAAAGKHHAAAMANLAATMFFPPVRIASVFLDLTTPNLVERYQRALMPASSAPSPKQAAGQPCYHEIWAPPPPQDAACANPLPPGTVSRPLWHGMTPQQAHEWLQTMTSAWQTQKEGWVAALAQVHRRAPLPPLATTPSSPALTSATALVSSSLAPPVTACAGRLSRIVHFVGRHSVDHLSAQDPHEVTCQILSQEVRAIGKTCSGSDAGLVAPFLPPLKLASFALPDASLDELLQHFEESTRQLTTWTLHDVADVVNRPGTRISLAPFGDQAATAEDASGTATVSIAPALLQRLDDIKMTRNQNFRAMRELEVESGRCLYHAYLYALTTLEEDAFMNTHADFSERVGAAAIATAANERDLSQQYWRICDEEAARVRGILATLVGTLSGTMRQLQCVHLRTIIDTVCLGVEETLWVVVASVLEAQKRRLEVAALQAQDAAADNIEWCENVTEALLTDALSAGPLSSTVTDDVIAHVLEAVHDNGTVMVNGVQQLWERLAQSLIPAASSILQRACQAAGNRFDSNDLEAQLFSLAVAQFEGALKASFLFSTSAASTPSPFNAMGAATQRHVAALIQHERLRKALSSGSSLWISHLFQHVSQLRQDPAAVAAVPRPHTFEDVTLPPELHAVGAVPLSMVAYAADAAARRELVLTDVQLQHLMLHMSLATTDASGSLWCLDSAEFQHFILSVQVSGFHHYVPSSLEDCVAPVLALTRTVATTRRILSTEDAVAPPRLFLPAWWLASLRHVVDGRATGPRGHFFTQEAAHSIFLSACGVRPGASGTATTQRVDGSLWLCHLCTGQLEAPSYILPDVAERTYRFAARRCATPNVVQLRVFAEALDACQRKLPSAVSNWRQLPWWPLSSCGADATAARDVSTLTLQQVLHVLSASNALASAVSIVARIPSAASEGSLTALCATIPLMERCVRWLLSSAVSSGPSAVLEFAFAIAASLRGRLGTTEAEVVPQPLANAHSKAFVQVDIVASVLERYQSTWSADDFKLYLLFTATGSTARVAPAYHEGGSDDESTSPMSTQYATPISERAEEISFSALNASHFGMHLLKQKRQEATAAFTGTLPVSEVSL